ncbi:MAG TPA: hypothetical protein V6C88_10755 [Chroococcidiopsis sp.]
MQTFLFGTKTLFRVVLLSGCLGAWSATMPTAAAGVSVLSKTTMLQEGMFLHIKPSILQLRISPESVTLFNTQASTTIADFPEADLSTADSPTAVIQALYDDFSPNNLRTSIFEQSPEVMLQYFNSNLVNLIVQDRHCRAQNRRYCNLDFDPLSDSQDPSISNLQIGVFDVERNQAEVRFLNYETPILLIFTLENTLNGWRISDIASFRGYSLVDLLSQ